MAHSAANVSRLSLDGALVRYGIAILSVAIAIALTLASRRLIHDPRPVIAYVAAILLTGWFAGSGPAALATVLVIAWYHWLLKFDGRIQTAWLPDVRDFWIIAFAVAAARFGSVRRRATSELEAAVAARTNELRSSEQALRAASEEALRVQFAVQLAERNRLAREMHDTLLQGFTGVALRLVAVTNRIAGAPDTVHDLHDVINHAQRTLEDARHAIWDIRSPVPGDLAAIVRAEADEALRSSGMTLEFRVTGDQHAVDPDVQAVFHRVAREAISNAARHSGAQIVRVELSYGARALCLSVIDDGLGFAVDPDLREYGGHWGLLGMRERATQIGATLSVQSTLGSGTTVMLVVPSCIAMKNGGPV